MNKSSLKKMVWVFLLSTSIFLGSHFRDSAFAHFQMIIPSDDMVSQTEKRELTLDVRFTHPFEGHGMNMEKPVQFGVLKGKKKIDLLDTLKEVQNHQRIADYHNELSNATLKRLLKRQ